MTDLAVDAGRTVRRERIRDSRGRLVSLLLSALLVIVTVGFLLPIFLMVRMSLASADDTSLNPFSFKHGIQWANYENAYQTMKYLPALMHTIGITTASVALTVLAGSLAAYPLSRIVRRWTKPVYLLFMAGLTVPVFVLLTPLYLLMRDLHLLNTWGGVVLIYTGFNLPLAVFFYTGFLRAVPLEIEEAAVVDGAGPWRVFWLIVFPLLRPITATLAIFISLSVWNDLIVPLAFLSGQNGSTVVLSAYSFVGSYGFKPGELFPAVVLATAPLLLFFSVLQRHIIAGIASGAVKS